MAENVHGCDRLRTVPSTSGTGAVTRRLSETEAGSNAGMAPRFAAHAEKGRGLFWRRPFAVSENPLTVFRPWQRQRVDGNHQIMWGPWLEAHWALAAPFATQAETFYSTNPYVAQAVQSLDRQIKNKTASIQGLAVKRAESLINPSRRPLLT